MSNSRHFMGEEKQRLCKSLLRNSVAQLIVLFEKGWRSLSGDFCVRVAYVCGEASSLWFLLLFPLRTSSALFTSLQSRLGEAGIKSSQVINNSLRGRGIEFEKGC
jgi:hypothetical protein